MQRDRKTRISISWKKAIRKDKICKMHGFTWYDNLHQYSKNKIHCSCPICARKTNSKYGRNPSAKDKRREESMEQDLESFSKE